MGKHRIQTLCGEQAGLRGTGRPKPSREANVSARTETGQKKLSFFALPRAALSIIPVDAQSAIRGNHTYIQIYYVLQIPSRDRNAADPRSS